MPLATDALLGDHLARLVADRLNAFVATTMRIGCSEHHLEFPGTLSISEDTFHGVVADIVRSSARGGFRRIVLLPTHGGNFGPLAVALDKLGLVDGIEVRGLADLSALLAIAEPDGPSKQHFHAANWGTPPPAGWALLLSCDEYPTGV